MRRRAAKNAGNNDETWAEARFSIVNQNQIGSSCRRALQAFVAQVELVVVNVQVILDNFNRRGLGNVFAIVAVVIGFATGCYTAVPTEHWSYLLVHRRLAS